MWRPGTTPSFQTTWDCCEISLLWGKGGNGIFMMVFENLLLYQYYSNNFQRRQICQVNICIKPHIITTVRLKLLSRKPLRFMWISLRNRLRERRFKLRQGHWYHQILIYASQITPVSFCSWLTGCKNKTKTNIPTSYSTSNTGTLVPCLPPLPEGSTADQWKKAEALESHITT